MAQLWSEKCKPKTSKKQSSILQAFTWIPLNLHVINFINIRYQINFWSTRLSAFLSPTAVTSRAGAEPNRSRDFPSTTTILSSITNKKPMLFLTRYLNITLLLNKNFAGSCQAYSVQTLKMKGAMWNLRSPNSTSVRHAVWWDDEIQPTANTSRDSSRRGTDPHSILDLYEASVALHTRYPTCLQGAAAQHTQHRRPLCSQASGRAALPGALRGGVEQPGSWIADYYFYHFYHVFLF